MKQQFSVRSPFWNLVCALLVIIFVGSLVAANPAGPDGAIELTTFTIPSIGIAAFLLLNLVVVYLSVILRRYNAQYKKIGLFQVFPAELIEDDERLAKISANATRNVYLYHNIALPLLVVFLSFQPPLLAIIVAVGALVSGHYITYWRGACR